MAANAVLIIIQVLVVLSITQATPVIGEQSEARFEPGIECGSNDTSVCRRLARVRRAGG
jgi:hypothetical protein